MNSNPQRAALSVSQLERFMRIVNALSPENLHCDGEISRAQARRKAAGLRAQWKALEAEVGRAVSEDEVWNQFVITPRGR